MTKIRFYVEIGFAVTALLLVTLFCVYAFKHAGDGAATWVQAFGSIAAILGSAATVGWQLKRQRDDERRRHNYSILRRIRQMEAICTEAVFLINQLDENVIGDREASNYFNMVHDPSHFSMVRAAIESVSLWDLPTEDLITPFILLRKAVTRSFDIAETLSKMNFEASSGGEYVSIKMTLALRNEACAAVAAQLAIRRALELAADMYRRA